MASLLRPLLGAGVCRSGPNGSFQNSPASTSYCCNNQSYRRIWPPSAKSLISSRREAADSDPRASAGKRSGYQENEVPSDGGEPFVVTAPKKLYALEYDYVSDYLTRREVHRQGHFQLLKKYVEQGKILLAGPQSPPYKALIIFRVDSVTEVENFVSQDPYAQNGIVVRSSAIEWHVVGGAWKDRL